ncbi:MAG: hypothetical protein OXG15_12505 [Gammaproteobacteria bacterium]|nr:hypothetical protein [Gammaproteobacteria bacterium]
MFNEKALFNGALDQVEMVLGGIGEYRSRDDTATLAIRSDRIVLNQMIDDVFSDDMEQSAKLLTSMIESNKILDKITVVGLNVGTHVVSVSTENLGINLCKSLTNEARLNSLVSPPENLSYYVNIATVFMLGSLLCTLRIEPSYHDQGKSLYIGLNAEQSISEEPDVLSEISDILSDVREYSRNLIERFTTFMTTEGESP